MRCLFITEILLSWGHTEVIQYFSGIRKAFLLWKHCKLKKSCKNSTGTPFYHLYHHAVLAVVTILLHLLFSLYTCALIILSSIICKLQTLDTSIVKYFNVYFLRARTFLIRVWWIAKWTLTLSPVLGMYVLLTVPQWEPFSRIQPWKSNVGLRPSGWYVGLNSAENSLWTFKILTGIAEIYSLCGHSWQVGCVSSLAY